MLQITESKGFAVLESLNDHDINVPVLRIGIPDQLVDHATPQQSKEALGLTPKQMSLKIQQRFGLGSGDAAKSSPFQAVQA